MSSDIVLHFNSGRVLAETAHGQNCILSDLSFDLKKGEKLALIGRTGSGKTMTALEIMGLLPNNVHSIDALIDFGANTKGGKAVLGKDIAYIPQSGGDYLNPSRKVKKQLYDNLGKKDEKLALEKLSLAGFDDPSSVLDKYPFELSGGMNQRVCIALAACSEPFLLIADEPTNGLDEKGRQNFLTLLDSVFPDAGKIIITHDPALAKLCDRLIFVGEEYEL